MAGQAELDQLDGEDPKGLAISAHLESSQIGSSLQSDDLTCELIFPWGKRAWPFRVRELAYLRWLQRLEPERRMTYLRRLIGETSHRNRLSYQLQGHRR